MNWYKDEPVVVMVLYGYPVELYRLLVACHIPVLFLSGQPGLARSQVAVRIGKEVVDGIKEWIMLRRGLSGEFESLLMSNYSTRGLTSR